MKRSFLFSLFIFSINIYSQNLINNEWQFKTGDSLVWKSRDFNSSSWKLIKSAQAWESQGYENFDGFGWYRKTVIIPSTLKKDAIKLAGLSLKLGAIDDADETFFNSKLLGASGEMPPHYVSDYGKIRNYNIKPEDIRWDKENVIAIRVYDGGGYGGLMNEVSLTVGGLESLISFKPHFPRPDQLFINNSKFSFPLEIVNSSKFNVDGKLEYSVVSDFQDTIFSGKENISVSTKSSKIISIDKGIIAPGFYTLYVDFKNRLFNFSKEFSIGVEPEKIAAPNDRPQDFDNFWMRAKKELAAVDPQFKLIKKDSLCTDKHDVYLVEMRSLENVLVRGWYVRPKAEGKYPTLLHVEGYGTHPKFSLDYKDEDMVHFILNIRGTGNSKDNVNPGFPGYILSNITDRERYIYRGAYMDCVRAVDFLCSRAEVDSRYIVVEGGSQGGALSFATAALNNTRICLCIPAVPFLSNFSEYFKVAKWPASEFIQFENTHQAFGWNKIYENLSYFDIKNLAPWVSCPVYMSVGLKDVTCPPRINFAAYNQLNTPKSYVVYPESGHGLPPEYAVTKYIWMKNELVKLKHQ